MEIKHWRDLPENPSPASGSCDLWLVWLDEEDPGTFLSILSNDEKLRVERYSYPQSADRFAVARGILRTLLGRYRSCNPEELVFSYGLHGKPELADDPGVGISFNVSHSGGLAVFAIANGYEVGVDIEEFHQVSDLDATASIFLSPDELVEFKTLAAGEKLEYFYNLWTSKEAILKAYGTGFSRPSRDVFAKFRKHGSNGSGQDVMIENKRLALFIPADGFRGALACL
jgi:4'-phosphopantetheinyl transferase